MFRLKKLKVKFKKLHPNAVIPKYANFGDAGLDLTAISKEGDFHQPVYGTGLAIEIPKGYVGLIFPRSSIYKKGIRLSNSVGVIDSQFRGEIKFVFDYPINSNRLPTYPGSYYKIGDRIGQLIIMPYPQIELIETEELSDTKRGIKGFGSSGN